MCTHFPSRSNTHGKLPTHSTPFRAPPCPTGSCVAAHACTPACSACDYNKHACMNRRQHQAVQGAPYHDKALGDVEEPRLRRVLPGRGRGGWWQTAAACHAMHMALSVACAAC